MRKILYSPGFGAGWSTWNDGDVAKYMLEYKPIIDAIESGKKDFSEEIALLEKECLEKFGEEYVCTLGAEGLEVAIVDGPVRINEYDGSESYEEPDDYEWL